MAPRSDLEVLKHALARELWCSVQISDVPALAKALKTEDLPELTRLLGQEAAAEVLRLIRPV